jgi:hypothetical protein
MLPTCEIIEFVAEDAVTPGTRDMQYEFEGREIKHDGRPTQPAGFYFRAAKFLGRRASRSWATA